MTVAILQPDEVWPDADGVDVPNPDTRRGDGCDETLIAHEPDGTAAGVCSLWWRGTAPVGGHATGHIGHYHADDPEAAAELLAAAIMRLADRGVKLALAPIDGSTWRRYRLVTWSSERRPFFMEPVTPLDWVAPMTAAGFVPIAHYSSAEMPLEPADRARLDARTTALAEAGITVRRYDPALAERTLTQLHALTLASFRDNFFYQDLPFAAFAGLYRPILPRISPDFVWLAERGDDLVGFVFAVPDFAQGPKPDTLIVKTAAVHPDARGLGLMSHLVRNAQDAALKAGLTRAIHALMADGNRSAQWSHGRAEVIRRYALFARSLDPAIRLEAAPG